MNTRLTMNIQLFSEEDDAAKKKAQELAGTEQKTPEQLELERVEQEKAETEAKAKEEVEKQRNAEEARKRREKERQEELEKAKKEARTQAIIETIKVNPYTQKELKDEDDVDTFMIMKQIEAEKGDPVKDYPEYVKKNKKEIVERQQEKTRIEEQAKKDVEEFSAAHPDVKLNELFIDEDFKTFSEGKIGNLPLKKIYEDYQKFIAKYSNKTEQEKLAIKKEAEQKLAETIAKNKATPGSLGNPGQISDTFTREQLEKMSLKEVNANYEKVMRSYEKIRKGEDKS